MGYGNDVYLIGNLGKEADKRTTPSGKDVANFSIATSRPGASKDAEWITQWHNIVCWGKAAVKAAKAKKGDRIFVHGELTSRSWEDKDGTKHYKTEVVVNFVNDIMIEPKEGSSGGGEEEY